MGFPSPDIYICDESSSPETSSADLPSTDASPTLSVTATTAAAEDFFFLITRSAIQVPPPIKAKPPTIGNTIRRMASMVEILCS